MVGWGNRNKKEDLIFVHNKSKVNKTYRREPSTDTRCPASFFTARVFRGTFSIVIITANTLYIAQIHSFNIFLCFVIYEESQKDAQLFTKRILMLDMEFWFFVGCKKRENKHISALISRMVVFNKDRV